MEIMYEGAVAQGRLSLNRWVDVCSTTPAKMFGLHPRKGTIAPGSDADLVVFNPQVGRVISSATHHMNVDYSVYEGMTVAGTVEQVFLRGQRIIEAGHYVGRQGDGRYLRRGLSSYLR